jgi:hypothetical protein
MDAIDSSPYVFNTHVEADEAIRSLRKSGFESFELLQQFYRR